MKQMSSRAPGFFVAPFAIDGEQEGIDYWELGNLSEKWLTICSEHLKKQGSSFDAPWGGGLSHIETRFTANSGAALVTFRVDGTVAASVALATGRCPAAEREVVQLFVDSLRRTEIVAAAARSKHPFQAACTILDRPLMIVVPWPDSEISERDQELVRELALHTAGAFIRAQGAEGAPSAAPA